MNKKLVAVSSSVLLVLPLMTMAIFVPPGDPVARNFVQVVDGIIRILWPLLAATATIIFFVAAFIFLTANGDPDKVKLARQAVLWGVVGIVAALVAVSVPGIIATFFFS